LRLKRILPARSISITFTVTSSPSFRTSSTRTIRCSEIWEMCRRPSVPGRISTKAPKSVIFFTLPVYVFPTSGTSMILWMIPRALAAAASSTEAISTVPSSLISILTPVSSMMLRIIFPPGPITSRILSTGILKEIIRGA